MVDLEEFDSKLTELLGDDVTEEQFKYFCAGVLWEELREFVAHREHDPSCVGIETSANEVVVEFLPKISDLLGLKLVVTECPHEGAMMHVGFEIA